MPKRKTQNTLEIPVTAMKPSAMPDGELGSRWFQEYPIGTEVLCFEASTTDPDASAEIPIVARTAGEAQYHKDNESGYRDQIAVKDAAGASSVRVMRYHVFPAKLYPAVAKKARNMEIVKGCGMDDESLRKKPVKKPTKPKETPEAMKRRQLDAAYSQKTEIESRLFDSQSLVRTLKFGIKESKNDREVIERMLYGPEDPPTDLMIRKYLLDEMEGRTRTIENCRRVIAEQTEATRSDRDRLTKILARIHRLHTVGPDPQQEFELDT